MSDSPLSESPTASASETASISEPEVILLLTSHAHSPPLQPSAQLKYDLRSIENPPKALRDSHTGLSKRLREHLQSHQDFTDLFDRAEADIRTAVAGLNSDAVTASGEATTLSVAAFCARGHHRSVAFVEELAARAWPSGWEVRVVHRDLQSGRSRQGKQKRGKTDGREAGGFHLVLGDE
jgi:RNase adaptor protein for sRNA GlmZ degradation